MKKFLKRSSAILLTAIMAATCVDGTVLSASAASSSDILSNEERGVIFADSRTDFRDESIYFLITTRFYDGDPSNNTRTSEDEKAQNPENDPSWRGDFKGLIDKLDYIKALGFTAIWITPVVENKSGYDYHGYHAYDFSAVDTRYESNGITYQDLIDACHAKGMKVIQDVVLNHTCNWGEKNLLQLTSDSYPERNQAVMTGSNDPENIYHHNGFCGGGDWDNYEAQRKTIADDCFDLETENPKVYNYLVDCYTKYINMGVDAFRVDTVKHISRLTFNSVFLPAFKEAGGDKFYMFGEVCTKGHDVWYRDCPPISTPFYTWADDASWTGRWSTDTASNESLVEEHYSANMNSGSQPQSDNAFLDGNNYHTPNYSQRSGLDVIDFQMHWSFNSANSAFNTALGEDKYYNDSTWNVVYVDSHDYAPDECQTQRYTGGTDAWAENLSLMFTFRGIPCVYYGSEIEFQKGMPIDVGPNAKLSETGRAYYGDHIEGNVDTSDFTVFGNVEGEVANTLNSTLSQHIMRLNRIRQSVPALRKGQYSTEGCSGNIAFKRRYTDSNTDSFVCVAISGNATFSGIPNGKYVDAVTGDVQNVSGGTLTANVSGKGNMKVYVLDTAKTPAPGRVIPNGDYLTDGGSAENIGPVEVDPGKIIKDTGVTLSESSVSVYEGDSVTVKATVQPQNATYKTVTWSSDNDSIATVSGGKITGVSAGKTKITATTKSGNTASVNVTVKENPNIVNPTDITLDPESLTLSEGGSASITATVSPSNATNKTVTWHSDNDSVATVSNGKVTAVSQGTANITASTFNGIEATATVTVTGKTYPKVNKGIYFEKPDGWGNNINAYFFDKTSDTTIGASWPGTAMTLDSATGIYTLEIPDGNSNYMIVFNDGSNQSPAQGAGGYEFVDHGLYTASGFSKVITENTDVEVASVKLNKTTASVAVGSTLTLTATVSPDNATNKTITWSSNNTGVAKVSSKGVVTGVKAGTAVITAKSNNGKSAEATITVTAAQALTNSSTLSATSIELGKSVTVTAKATGGTTPYKYAVYYKKTTDSSWTTKQDFTTNAKVSITPAVATTYDVCVKVKDAKGTVAKKYFTVKVTKALTNSSTLSATSIALGKSVTVTAKATGGTTPYKYAVYYKKTTDTSWKTKQDYTTNAKVSITPAVATTYDVCVKVKDAKGTVAKKYFTVKVTKALTNSSTLSATSIALGKSVTVTAKATGGTTPYKYAVYYKKTSATAWTTKQDYTTNAKVSITPASAATYDVCVKVKDAKGTVAKKYFTVKVTNALTNSSTLSATSIALGKSVTVTAKATGGTTPYKYAVYYKKTSATAWTTKQDYTTNAKVSITPASAATYDVCVKVKDAKGTVAKKYFTVKVTKALTNSSTLSATSIALGKSVTVTAKATGGTTPYKYAVYYKKTSTTSWTTKQDYTTNAKVSITPASATTYDVCVKVKDAKGTIAKKYFTVKVTNATKALANSSTVNATSVKLGKSVTITGKATGGTTPYKYAVYYKKTSATSWTTKQDYTTNAKVSLTPASATTYDVCVKVKDAKGTVAKKYFTVNVTNALTNSSTLSATSIALGKSVTITGKATGGTSPYTYAAYYKKSSSSTWTRIRDYSSTATMSVKPASATTYTVRVKVKDAKGTVVNKDITVKVTK